MCTEAAQRCACTRHGARSRASMAASQITLVLRDSYAVVRSQEFNASVTGARVSISYAWLSLR
jgi:hypothetical protein